MTTEYKYVQYDVDGHVAVITMNRPEVMNSYHNDMLTEMRRIWDTFANDPNQRVAILRGAGRAFCAGHDMSHLDETFNEPGSLHYGDLEIYKPIIAAVHGPTLGGGASLALGCDIRVAADDLRFGYPQVTAGFMSVGGHNRLPRSTHHGLAVELMLTGQVILAERALAIGLVNHVVPLAELDQKAREIADRIAANAPLAVQATKEALVWANRLDFRDGIAYAKVVAHRLSGTHDWEEGVQAFREKRQPVFEGR